MDKLKNPILWFRLALGWLFFYTGITKILDPEWSAEGFLNGAKTFSKLFAWFALPQNIGWVNFLNEWGLTFIGLSLLLGIAVRWASYAGTILMLLYYFPGLKFPYVAHGFLIDEHIIYILIFLMFIKSKEIRLWGLGRYLYFKKK